ncbi:MAG: GIY-YIG nuclease family protein [Nostoc sp.]|uniref:GIY-YIG nuclease family protein n=1 Tax=Nostoc sp. TaxID=1180 RepID=UPI002FFA1425
MTAPAPELINLSDLPSLTLNEKNKLPEITSIYFVISEKDEILYIGRTINLRQRWATHHRLTEFLSQHETAKVSWVEVKEASLLISLEKSMISYFKPSLNGKKIAYLIDVEEDFSMKELEIKVAQNEKSVNQNPYERELCSKEEDGQNNGVSELQQLSTENEQRWQEFRDRATRIREEITFLRSKNKELEKENEQLRAWRDSILAIAKIAPGS